MYAGPHTKPLPSREEAVEAYWQEVEDRVELAEFGPIARVDEERVEAAWTAMQADSEFVYWSER